MNGIDMELNEVFNKTYDLAHALMASDAYKSMKAAESAAMADEAAKTALSEYASQKQALEELLTSKNPDAKAINERSAALEAVQKRMNGIETLTAMTEARNGFSQLINQVNQILAFVITGKMSAPEQDEGESCTGSCATCKSKCGLN